MVVSRCVGRMAMGLLVISLPACSSSPYQGLLDSDARKPAAPREAQPAPPPALEEVPAEVPEPRREPLPQAGAGEDEILLPVAWVRGDPIPAEDLLMTLRLFYPRPYDEALTALVAERVVELELDRLNYRPDLSDMGKVVDGELERQRKLIKGELGAKTTLEDYLQEVYRADVETYRSCLLRAEATRRKTSILARYDQLRYERREIRRIVLDSLEEAIEVQSLVQEGADLSTLTTKKGRQRDDPRRGRLPPLRREDVDEPWKSAVFGISEGELTPVLELGGGAFGLARLLRIHVPLGQPLSEAGPLVEADLAARPLEQVELRRWNALMVARYDVRLTR